MKRQTAKLMLNRETLHSLQNGELKLAVGGTATNATESACPTIGCGTGQNSHSCITCPGRCCSLYITCVTCL
jgi:hypothetical protein